ncbi:MAG: two-component regulator propeller domain-containing protein, partial [Bacteroidota bacterium]
MCPPVRLAVLVFALVTVVSATRAQPVSERVTRADGVPSDYVLALHQDRWGFVWMGTDAGAVRWDGTRARTFSTDDGLPHPYVTGFAETPDGAFWAATNGGLARQRPDGDWEVVDSPFGRTPVGYLTTDTEGRLVISGRATVARREDGLWRSVRTAPRHSSAPVLDVGGGRLLVSSFREATALLLTPEASGGFRAQRLTVEGLAMEPGRGSFAIYPDAASDDPSRFVGLVDASDDDRVVRFRLDVRRQRLVVTGTARVPGGAGDLAWHDGAAHGAGSAGIRPLNVRTGETGPYLLRAHVRSTLTDREGGLWVGTFGEGAARIMSTHLTVLSEIPSRRIALVGDEAWAFGGAGATHVDLSGAEPLAESWERSGPRSVVAMPDGRFRVSGQAYLFAPLDTPGVIRSLRGQNVFPGTAEDGNWVSGSAETADSLWLGSYGSGVRRFLKA